MNDEWKHEAIAYDSDSERTVRVFIDGHEIPEWAKYKLLRRLWWWWVKREEKRNPRYGKE